MTSLEVTLLDAYGNVVEAKTFDDPDAAERFAGRFVAAQGFDPDGLAEGVDGRAPGSVRFELVEEGTTEPTDRDIYERACELYLSDDIDVLTVSVDRHPDGNGAWVSALVWVPLPFDDTTANTQTGRLHERVQ